MSGAETEPRTEAEAGGAAPLEVAEPAAMTETEDAETAMAYGDGRVPWFVVAMWALAAIGLGAYALRFVAPAFTAWGAP